MKKLIIALFVFLPFFSFWRTYPLKEVSKPTVKCKYSPWSTLGPSCKISLPKLTPADYKKYLNNLTYRRIYTVLWWATYKYGWDQGYGSHEGVDIATSLWTPVYSIWPGKVVFAGWKKWRGKVVVIQHKVNWKYIYSNYAHLNKIFVKFWQYVKEWQKIWEVWHTGFSIGNHLHFQIDTNEWISTHPFWFKYCARWRSTMQITNDNKCLNELTHNTVDPLKFLATNGAIIKAISKQNNKPKIISRKNMISYEEIRKQMVKEFLKTHKFSFNFPNAGVYYLGKYGHFTITLKDRRWRSYKDILPDDLKIIYDKAYFSSFYPRVLKIVNGTRKVTFLPKKTWATFITVKLWDFVVYQKAIRIVKPGQTIQPYAWDILTFPKILYVSYPARWINIFKDKSYLNLVKVPFKWTYYLSSTTNDVIFCKAPTNLRFLNYFQCNALNMTNQLAFSYKDTIFGLLVFKFFSNTWKPTQLVIKDSRWKVISKSQKLYFHKIKLTDPRSEYASDIQQACKMWLCLGLIDKGYIWVDKPLSKYQMKQLLRNFLLVFGKKVKLNLNSKEKYQYVTRKEFIENTIKLLWIKIKNYSKIPKYIDVRNQPKEFQNLVIYLTKLWFKWKDRFAKYHFQPDKNITVWEALYFAKFMIKKLTN